MKSIKNTTGLIGMIDPNIITLVFENGYSYRGSSKTRTPTLLRLKKRRFQCKGCRKVTGAETLIVEKNHQISNLVRQKVSQLLTEKMSLTDIARRLRMSTSTVYRKLDQFTFKEHFDKLPRVMSWD